jgi:Protein ENHANCED DISEASE RESISTANCE 2, C-terminal
VKSDRYFEVILDCGSSPVATGVIRLSLGYAKTLVVDMGFLLEGDEDEYLPERIFGCVRMKNIDFGPRMRHVIVQLDNSENVYTYTIVLCL